MAVVITCVERVRVERALVAHRNVRSAGDKPPPYGSAAFHGRDLARGRRAM